VFRGPARYLLLILLLTLGSMRSFGGPAVKPLTVADAIETTRFMQSARGQDPRGDGVFVSPDRQRYVIMLIRGDLKRRCNWVEILAGRLDSLEHAEPKRVALLSTDSLGSPDPTFSVPAVTWPGFNPPVWLPDSLRVAFYWPDSRDVVQLASLNVVTGEFVYLTHAARDVTSFDVSPTGGFLYTALVEHSRDASEELLRNGFTVKDDALLVDLLNGDVDGYGAFDRAHNVQWFSLAGLGENAQSIAPDTDRWGPIVPAVFSSDGRQVLIQRSPSQIPQNWSRYTERGFALHMSAYQVSPADLMARYIPQLFVVDRLSATMRPLWSAPAVLANTKAAWSPDGRSVLVGPTFLPTEHSDTAGIAGLAIAEVEAASGRYRQLKIPDDLMHQPVRALRWLGSNRIEVIYATSRLQFTRASKEWKPATAIVDARQSPLETPAVRVVFRQDANTPPVLYGTDSTGVERALLDLNPELKNFSLGHVEFIDWKDKQGRAWRGRLYHPVREPENGTRVPLVIQTHGYASPDQFSLYGKGNAPGLGPGYSVYAAQPLANRGIAVLQIGDDEARSLIATPEEPEAYASAYEGAVEYLAGRGLVDVNRVGLVGFSRTGWHVMYALTHSSFRYAAAITSDNMDGGYIQAALQNWSAEPSQDIGAEPFGEGLKAWFERSPAFGIDKLTTPLRIQIESWRVEGLMGAWELYSRARYLHKPVELYVIPTTDRGSHGIQNPWQSYAAQQGAVEWFEAHLHP